MNETNQKMAAYYEGVAREKSAEIEDWAQDAIKLTDAENSLASAYGLCTAAMDSNRCIQSGINSIGDNFTDVLVEGLSYYLDFSEITVGMGQTDSSISSLQSNIESVMQQIDAQQEVIGRKIQSLTNERDSAFQMAQYYRTGGYY